MRNRRLLLSFALVLTASCQREEEITHYSVPRVEPAPVAQAESVRLVAAIVPDQEKNWFFRMDGPEEATTPHVAAFEKFLKTVKLTGKADEPITWDLPAGWERHPGVTSQRMGFKIQTYATLKIKAEPQPLEIAVSSAGGNILSNVNRWREQIGLAKIRDNELADHTKTVDAGGVTITWVNMVGVRAAPAPTRPRSDGVKRDDESAKITYQLPMGWKDQPPTVQFAVKQFDPGVQDVKVTITQAGGGLAANVKRWRDMAKLPELRGKDLDAAIQTIDVADVKAGYVDIENPKEPRLARTLGVIVPGRGSDWIVKMWGPSEAVGREKTNFEALVKSLRFGGK